MNTLITAGLVVFGLIAILSTVLVTFVSATLSRHARARTTTSRYLEPVSNTIRSIVKIDKLSDIYRAHLNHDRV